MHSLRFFIIASLLLIASPLSAQTTVITADHLLDIESGELIDNPVVVIEGNLIAAVGSGDAVSIPADATRLDLPGQTLLPGFMDMHIQLI